ncbi:MAG: type II toxin-antitoxin system PemK/MazF family toxin [Xanthobacteraceae bacterium]|jgi:mRNA interferase MazF
MERQVKRGEIWTAAGGGDYAAKPRPAVIIQHDLFDALDSITICGFTRDPIDLPLFRILVEPSPVNGLEFPSRIMIDKILTVRKAKLGFRIGRLDHRDAARLDRAIATFLGLTD